MVFVLAFAVFAFIGRRCVAVGNICGMVRMIIKYWEAFADHFFNASQIAAFIMLAEGYSYAIGTGPSRASNSMYIIFWFVRNFEIDDMSYAIYIYAAGGNIGSH